MIFNVEDTKKFLGKLTPDQLESLYRDAWAEVNRQFTFEEKMGGGLLDSFLQGRIALDDGKLAFSYEPGAIVTRHKLSRAYMSIMFDRMLDEYMKSKEKEKNV